VWNAHTVGQDRKGLAEDRQMGHHFRLYIAAARPSSLVLSLQDNTGGKKRLDRDNTWDGSVMIPCLEPCWFLWVSCQRISILKPR
jgi:hypothetical protein